MTKLFKAAMLAATASASFAAVPALADSGVLVVDFNQVFATSAAGQSGTSQLQAKYNGRLTQLQGTYRSAVEAYNAQVEAAKKVAKPNTPLPPATQQSLQAAGERAQQSQEQLQQLQEEVNQAAGYVRSQIIDKAGPVAEQIRGEKKASVVISKDAALASDPAADITATLIQRLNTAFPTPSIVPPAQAPAGAPSTGTAPQGR